MNNRQEHEGWGMHAACTAMSKMAYFFSNKGQWDVLAQKWIDMAVMTPSASWDNTKEHLKEYARQNNLFLK